MNKDEVYLLQRLKEGNVSNYAVSKFPDSLKKLLQSWVKQKKVVKVENIGWSGQGNKHNYWLVQ